MDEVVAYLLARALLGKNMGDVIAYLAAGGITWKEYR